MTLNHEFWAGSTRVGAWCAWTWPSGRLAWLSDGGLAFRLDRVDGSTQELVRLDDADMGLARWGWVCWSGGEGPVPHSPHLDGLTQDSVVKSR